MQSSTGRWRQGTTERRRMKSFSATALVRA
jgi:hypothetical protein